MALVAGEVDEPMTIEGFLTKDEAVNEFYDKVAATYPDIEIDRQKSDVK